MTRQLGFVSEAADRRAKLKYRLREWRSWCANTIQHAFQLATAQLKRLPWADIIGWCIETLLEGLLVTTVLTAFWHIPFTFLNVVASGIVVKKSLDYLSTLRSIMRKEPNGHTSHRVPETNKRD